MCRRMYELVLFHPMLAHCAFLHRQCENDSILFEVSRTRSALHSAFCWSQGFEHQQVELLDVDQSFLKRQAVSQSYFELLLLF